MASLMVDTRRRRAEEAASAASSPGAADTSGGGKTRRLVGGGSSSSSSSGSSNLRNGSRYSHSSSIGIRNSSRRSSDRPGNSSACGTRRGCSRSHSRLPRDLCSSSAGGNDRNSRGHPPAEEPLRSVSGTSATPTRATDVAAAAFGDVTGSSEASSMGDPVSPSPFDEGDSDGRRGQRAVVRAAARRADGVLAPPGRGCATQLSAEAAGWSEQLTATTVADASASRRHHRGPPAAYIRRGDDAAGVDGAEGDDNCPHFSSRNLPEDAAGHGHPGRFADIRSADSPSYGTSVESGGEGPSDGGAHVADSDGSSTPSVAEDRALVGGPWHQQQPNASDRKGQSNVSAGSVRGEIPMGAVSEKATTAATAISAAPEYERDMHFSSRVGDCQPSSTSQAQGACGSLSTARSHTAPASVLPLSPSVTDMSCQGTGGGGDADDVPFLPRSWQPGLGCTRPSPSHDICEAAPTVPHLCGVPWQTDMPQPASPCKGRSEAWAGALGRRRGGGAMTAGVGGNGGGPLPSVSVVVADVPVGHRRPPPHPERARAVAAAAAVAAAPAAPPSGPAEAQWGNCGCGGCGAFPRGAPPPPRTPPTAETGPEVARGRWLLVVALEHDLPMTLAAGVIALVVTAPTGGPLPSAAATAAFAATTPCGEAVVAAEVAAAVLAEQKELQLVAATIAVAVVAGAATGTRASGSTAMMPWWLVGVAWAVVAVIAVTAASTGLVQALGGRDGFSVGRGWHLVGESTECLEWLSGPQ